MPNDRPDPRHAPPSTPSIAVEGVVDGIDGSCVRGWAWIPAQPQRRVDVIVRAAGAPYAHGVADQHRADLVAAGKGDGACAFRIAFDTSPEPGVEIEVCALIDGMAYPLAGSPLLAPAPADASTGDARPDVLPLPIHQHGLRGSLDQCGPTLLRGWVQRTDAQRGTVELTLCEGATEWLCCKAEHWRADVAEHLQLDGCCGFEAPLPAALRDGVLHTLTLREAGSNVDVLDRPLRVRAASDPAHARNAGSAPIERPAMDAPLTLSVVVNFYNMQREAARTLTSLTRAYQRDIGDLDYEVLCIDNGSNPPLDPEWIAGFGPEFRLIRPGTPAPSPCAALNEAARQARGRYLALMIDGAHLLTPGVLREALAAWREDSDAIVAVRHWFVGGDQRFLAASGYTRELEDRLFERIHWPNDGYALFRVGAPIGEHPDPWVDGLSESNCLLLPTALFDRIGGFDPAFAAPGGGFANLDLWRRASDAAAGSLVSLVGEATFHQFHEGTTTNVRDAEKDQRVRRYAQRYRTLRGRDFDGVHRSRLRFRGAFSSDHAVGVRQRPLLPMDLDVTGAVRAGQPELHFDEGARQYLQAVYAECAGTRRTTWLGAPTGVAPADLNAIQRILHDTHPDAVIAAGGEPGIAAFIADVLTADANPAPILAVGAAPAADAPKPRIQHVDTHPHAPHAAAIARQWLGGAENVLVILACPADASLAADTLAAWGALVSHRSWLIITGTVLGQPWLGYSNRRHRAAIHAFVTAADAQFVIERDPANSWLTTCADGFLRKVSGALAAADCDATLDALPVVAPLAEETTP